MEKLLIKLWTETSIKKCTIQGCYLQNIAIEFINHTGNNVYITEVFVIIDDRLPYRYDNILNNKIINCGYTRIDNFPIASMLEFRNAVFEEFYIEIHTKSGVFKSNKIQLSTGIEFLPM